MVYIQLSNDEKLQVILLAFAFFLFASILSLCLAAGFCPLNRWLLRRSERRRHRKLQQQQISALNSQIQQRARQHLQAASPGLGSPRQYHFNQRLCQGQQLKGSLASYSGPPPAYEAALRATRLQSLTGSLYSNPEEATPVKPGPPAGVSAEEKEDITFGDYFHQPRDGAPAVHIPMGSSEAAGSEPADKRRQQQQQPPLMLRLWVRVLEPGELVARVRQHSASSRARCESSPEESLASSTIRRLSLSKQLSLPQFFGSLVGSLSKGDGERPPEADQTPDSDSRQLKLSNSAPGSGAGGAGQQAARGQTGNPYQQDNRMLKTISSITSRVLHMNVASFSYVRDEALISSKRHSQMNFHHFCGSPANKPPEAADQQNMDADSKKLQKKARQEAGKFCQLVISICDIENVLNSSWLNERSCALLANNSAIYVQCEILLPKSKSARLLGPLRTALSNTNEPRDASEEGKRHTVNFASVISASAVERPPVGGCAINIADESLLDDSLGKSSSISSTSCSEASTNANNSNNTNKHSTNWRHEPNADGQSIVVFSSVPKEIAQQQQLTASAAGAAAGASGAAELAGSGRPLSDMIQFDSVFVSPILNKSTIADGFIRLRIYSQCKYVNETCLAELKLPLKQLLASETSDNLNDAAGYHNGPGQHQQQADFILNNLLANLVTASTGSPLSTLIEQISSEERETAELLRGTSDTAPNALKSMLSIPWLGSAAANQPEAAAEAPASEQSAARRQATNKGLRGSLSYNESLHKLVSGGDEGDRKPAQANQLAEETERRIEENYLRSLMVSHWLNYLVAPSYECQLVSEHKGKIILGLSYLPTSNRVIFNATRATIDDDGYASGKHMMKNLRLQTSTCYLLRFMMIVNGRVVKRKQTPVGRKPEWDSQEPITFDLVSVSVEQPSFIVALVMRNSTGAMSTGSLQNLGGGSQQQHVCNCGLANHQQLRLPAANRAKADVQSEPESLQHFGATYRATSGACNLDHHHHQQNNAANSRRRQHLERDLVIGHLVLGDEIWREMRAQPRKQIVKQFKMY